MWRPASMGSPVLKLLIQSRSINKYGYHRQFLFLIGRFLEIFFSETALPNEPKPIQKVFEATSQYQIPDPSTLCLTQDFGPFGQAVSE
jgi:hypothetical protein